MLASVFEVFTEVANWLVEIMPIIMSIFYTPATETDPGRLTFIGVISIASLAFSVVLLILYIVKSYLRFR